MTKKRTFVTASGKAVMRFKKGKKFLYVTSDNEVVLIQN